VQRLFEQTGTRSLHYVSSRGRPHRCGFCADCVIYRQQWNALSAERVLDDLQRPKRRYEYDTVRFYDSNLLVSEQRTVQLCEGVIDRGLDSRWDNCNGDVHVLARYNHSTLALMARAGVSNVLLGMESGYEPALELIDKVATVQENLAVVERSHHRGISIGFSFMFGFPYEMASAERRAAHQEEIITTARLLATLSRDYTLGDHYLWFAYTPYPGVRFYPLYLRLGYEPPATLEGWGEVNLDRTGSSPWVDEDAFESYDECLQLKWYLMHALGRSLAHEGSPRWWKWLAAGLDTLMGSWLTSRVER